MRSARKFALALKTFWAPLNFPLILEFLKVGNVQQNNDISSFNSFLGQIFTDISNTNSRLLQIIEHKCEAWVFNTIA